jgi:hypothetical protein
MEMQARLGNFILRLAETKFNRQLIRLHRIDGLENPEAKQGRADQQIDRAIATAATTATGEYLLQAVLAFAQNIFEIRWRVLSAAARALRALSPGAVIIVVIIIVITAAATPWAAAAILIAPGHPHL